METKIVIPSHKRAETVTTTKVVEGCILCVEEKQAAKYRQFNKGVEIETHPDEVVGINAKRQWMLERWKNEAIMMLDDDILSFRRMYRPPARKYPRKSTIDKPTAREIIESTAHTASKFGAYLFGFGSHCNPQTYQPLKPFGFGGYIPGGCTGFLPGHGLSYQVDVTIPGEDYYICAMNAKVNRIAWIDKRFAFEYNKTYNNSGGMSEYRGADGEEKGRRWLVNLFGAGIITMPHRTPWTKMKKNAALRHLKIPWHV